MKTCKKCKNTMFDIDIKEDGFCGQCANLEKIPEWRRSDKDKEVVMKCKGCGNEIKAAYLSSDYLCFNCDNKNKESNNYTQDKNGMSKIETHVMGELEKKLPQARSKIAIIGFVFSIVAIFGIGIAGLVGFIMGIVALTQIKHTKERGKAWAVAAVIIGFIWSFGIGVVRRLVEMGY